MNVKMIKGQKTTLRPATLEDRHMIFKWGHDSDIASFIYPPGSATKTFEDFCDDWKENFFTDEEPRLGRMFIILYRDSPVGTVAYNDIDPQDRVELDIWMNSEANCGKGLGPDAINALCSYLSAEFSVRTFMMQPSARNPRAIRAYEKAGFVRTPATPEQIAKEWGGVDSDDSVLMIRNERDTMDIEIRLLSPSDADVLLNVAPETFDDPIDMRSTREFLSDAHHHLAVAVDDGVVVGFISAVHYLHPDKPRPELWINEVGVAPTHRGRGLGKAILDRILKEGRHLDCSEAWVLTEVDNIAAMRLYASLGGVEGPHDGVMFTFTLDAD